MNHIIPKHPYRSADEICKNCFHWLRKDAQKLVLIPTQTPQGPALAAMPFEQAVQSGNIGKGQTVEMSQCTRFPQWQMTRSDHHCYEWKDDWSDDIPF